MKSKIERVPTFVHALRRRAGEELARPTRHRLELLEKASRERSADVLAALAPASVRDTELVAFP
jgi:hypothetical protein